MAQRKAVTLQNSPQFMLLDLSIPVIIKEAKSPRDVFQIASNLLKATLEKQFDYVHLKYSVLYSKLHNWYKEAKLSDQNLTPCLSSGTAALQAANCADFRSQMEFCSVTCSCVAKDFPVNIYTYKYAKKNPPVITHDT